MKQSLFVIVLFISLNSFAQYTGLSGVYYLGTANIPISATTYSNPSISGIVVRFKWNDLEPSPGNFNWSFIDGEIAKAVTYNKKISLQPLSTPDWLGSTGVKQYYYIDNNTAHPTFGQVVSGIISWDSIYVERYKLLLQNLALKYASNPTVTYLNTIGGAFSRNLPDTILIDTILLTKQAFWKAYNYNADTLGKLINAMTDYFMLLFPTTHLWCSVDYVKFETKASGRAINYLATVYSSYGITHYSDRFGLWREDIAGCNPQLPANSTNQWYILQENPCRCGAQMLWNVQEGPTRMNQCGILPNTKAVVLDSAVNKGLRLGMRYLEIYGADIEDVSLANSIQSANNKLIAKGKNCDSITGINDSYLYENIVVFPNPFTNKIQLSNTNGSENYVLYNTIGECIWVGKHIDKQDLSALPNGIYFVKTTTDHTVFINKLIKN